VALQLAGAIAVLISVLWLNRAAGDERSKLVLVLSAWAVWQLLLGPGTERPTYAIVAPLVAWAVLDSVKTRKGRVLAVAAWVMTAPLAIGGLERGLGAVFPAASLAAPAGALLFGVWLMIYGRRRAIAAAKPAWIRQAHSPIAA
jgi:hypothetical protein